LAENFALKKNVTEGLHLDSPNYRFLTAWHNTLHVRHTTVEDFNHEYNGTMFVAFRLDRNDSTYLGLVTAKHVLDTLKKGHLDLYKNILIDDTAGTFQVDEDDVLRSAQFLTIDVAEKQDLSFIVIRLSGAKARGLTGIPFPKTCALSKGEPLASVGFPYVPSRLIQDQKVPLDRPTFITKRWTSGFYTGHRLQVKLGPVVGTTLDSIAGSSGSAIVNAKGEVVGVLATSAKGGERYFGKEDGTNFVAQTYMVDCESTKNFAEKSWQKFLSKITTGI
jgi:hypothetical protein